MGDLMEERWQTKITSLKEGLIHIYNTKEFSDVEFLVHGERFKAHKLVLASRSSEFARILLKPSDLSEVVVDVEAVTKLGFAIVLDFVYKDVLEAPDKRSIIEAYFAAIHYKIKSLQDRCVEKMETWTITTDEVFRLFDVASEIPYLRVKCIQFVQNHSSEVLTSPLFYSATPKTMSIILESGVLKDIPAMDRIRHVVKWGEVQMRMQTQDDFSPVRDLLLSVKIHRDEPLLSRLEFQTLRLEDLAVIASSYPNLLSSTEIVTFMTYDKSKSLPEWCKVISDSCETST